MEASSAVNTPHPDASEADAEDFFGGDTPGDELAEQITEEEMEAEAAATAAEPDAPLPSDEVLQADAEAYAAQHAAEAADGPHGEQQEKLREISEREKAEAAAAAVNTAAAAATTAATPVAAAAPKPEKVSGKLEREYIVFQQVVLTDKVLRHLLKQIDEGNAPEPRVAYVELHRAVSRNDKQAIGLAYAANKESLGAVCDLAAVSSRSFKERHVAPKPPTPDSAISIT